MLRLPRLVCLLSLLFVLPAALAAQSYTSVVVFGDSLSDTGNIAHLVESSFFIRYPGPQFNYTDGRFTDGTDTHPAAAADTGVWVEQLAAALPAHPAVYNSLDGGTDYAYGDATTANGTTTVSETTGVSITLNNMGQQVTDYLTAHPTVPAGTLVIVWGGANDLAAAASATSPQQVQTIVDTAVTNEVALVQRLINAGATDILVPNLPPLGSVPDFNSNMAVSAAVTAAAQLFNTGLNSGLAQVTAAQAGVHLFQLDTFTLFKNIIDAPGANGLTNVTGKSQGQAVDPDQFLFWDGLHPTTTGHALLAAAARNLLTPVSLTTTTTLTSSALTSNLASSVTFTAVVSAATGAPTGTVTFADGSTTLGTGTLTGSSATTSTATLATSTLSAGTHTITASYAGSTGFAASTSGPLTQTVVAPNITVTASPTTLTVKAGSSGTSTLTVTPAGGFSGSVAFACQSVPTNASCTVNSTPPMTFSTPQTFTLTILTNGKTASVPAGLVALSFTGPGALLIGMLGSLSLGLLHLGRRRAPQLRPGLLILAVLLSSATLFGLSGCGNSSHNTAKGTYSIPVVVTPSTGTASTVNISLVVQ